MVAVKIAWKLDEDDGVGFTGKIDIVLATYGRYELGRRGTVSRFDFEVHCHKRQITTNIGE